jgi:hypothetical protein
MTSRWWLWAALGCLAACGGQTRDDGGSGGSIFGPSAGGSTSGCDGCALGATQPLGDCESAGFLQTEAYGRPCNWLFEDTCYDTREDACECGCPRDQGDVICISGSYEGDGNATEVSCIPRP